jgi:multicomponent Na+:H+ antiporter subunit E
MFSFVATTLFSFGVYLLLIAGSGNFLGLWSRQDALAGLLLSIGVGWVARSFFCDSRRRAALDPMRWVRAVGYACGPFLVEMAKANLDVAYRVVTGRIRPGIVRVRSGMKTDLGTLMLANSITLTPGTLTVDVDEESNDLFVHMINVPVGLETRDAIEARELFSTHDCPSWIRRIAE